MEMKLTRRLLLPALAIAALLAAAGCSQPQPPAATAEAPPPPPPPEPEPQPQPAPPPQPQPDPYETAVAEVGRILKRYTALFGEIRDQKSADKAVAEIGRLNTRLRELAEEIKAIPYEPAQAKHTLALQTELSQIATAQLTNSDFQRVLADPDLAIPVVAAQQAFLLEGVAAIGQAILARTSPAAQPSTTPPPQKQ